MLRSIVGLLIAVIVCSCFQQKSKGALHAENSFSLPESKTGLRIENSLTRGTGFTDSLGSEYIIVHITNTITNDSTIPIQLEMDLPREYHYPISDDSQKFRIVLWPGLTEPPHLYSDSAGQIFANSIDNESESQNQFNQLLEPGEKYLVTIGTIVPSPPKICSVVAFSIVEYNERKKYSDCDWPMDEVNSTNPKLALGLKVGFCTSGQQYKTCAILPCGQITYTEN